MSPFRRALFSQMVAYDRVLFLDSDMLALRPVDELFSQDADLAFTNGPCSRLNSGLLALRPSAALYDGLRDAVRTGDFNWGTGWAGTGLARARPSRVRERPFFNTFWRPPALSLPL